MQTTALSSGETVLLVSAVEGPELIGSKRSCYREIAGKIVRDPDLVQQWIDAASEWVQQPNIGGYMKGSSVKEPNPDHFKQINYRNLERVTLRFRREHGIASLVQRLSPMRMPKPGVVISSKLEH